MRRLAIFRECLLPGSETFIRTQARALKGWQPTLLGLRRAVNGLSLDDLPHRIIEDRTGVGYPVTSAITYLANRPHLGLVRALHAISADVVHVHFGVDAVRAWPSVRATGVPMLVTLHGYDICVRRDWWESGAGGWRRRFYPERLMKMAHHPTVSFVAVSEAIRQRALEWGIPSEKIAVSYIGVDVDGLVFADKPMASRPNRILFVGRMVEKKAPLLLLRAFAKVRLQVPDAELVFVGDGPLLPEVVALAGRMGVPIQTLGIRPWADVKRLMREARAFCLPSVTARNGDAEGLPTVLLEAMASGVPVVTSAQGGVGEAVRHLETGIAFPEGDEAELASHLARLLANPALGQALAASARKHVERNFRIEACAESFEALLDRHAERFS
ncbi:MAG TPA: glycosyltransferase [Acidobacteriaceae bacterium]|nr:glycosyltransferase [Acidobacteriaceae bacterium]